MARHWFPLAAMLLMLASAPAPAEAPSCTLPTTIPVPKPALPSTQDPKRVMPIGGYTLAVSWAPEYCATGEGMGGAFDKRFECDRKSNRFGLVLHGLWPDGMGKSWPQFCRATPLLDAATVRANLCMTPSADLLQHEWAKHGTCMAATPASYFATERAVYENLHFPDMADLAQRTDLTVGAFTSAFLAANRGGPARLPAGSVRVALSKQGWLQEVRICLNRQLSFTRCKSGSGTPAKRHMRIRIGE